ncbi:MAG: hypothetical protein H0T77_03410 [Pyrinomonadaceae bacterium]|nr:hypothetical protein [Pyrinomonadaceae bacterium]
MSQVARILERYEITYVLVGSLASSMHGMYRSTAHIDLLADVKPEHVQPLLDALNKSFYVDEHAVQQAVEQRRSFNAIHFDSVFKVDIFIAKADDFARKQLERRELRKIAPEIDQFIYVATAEDTVLAKLRWYREGDEVSNNQWSDVLGVLGAQSVSTTTCASGRISSELWISWRGRFYLSKANSLTQGTHDLPSPGRH